MKWKKRKSHFFDAMQVVLAIIIVCFVLGAVWGLGIVFYGLMGI